MVYGVGEGEGERTQRREALASDAAAVSALPPRSHPRLSAATIAATHAAAFISASRSSPPSPLCNAVGVGIATHRCRPWVAEGTL
jgi:hypothetical protein